MTAYAVTWSVKETVVGPGEHDGGVREGDVHQLGQGYVVKDDMTPAEIYEDLGGLLRGNWPPTAYGGTYNLERTYDILVEEVPTWITVNGGEVFDGTPEQFADSFFSNVTKGSVEEWCHDMGYEAELKFGEGSHVPL